MGYEYHPEWDREMQPSVIGVPIGCQPQPDGNVVQTPEKRGPSIWCIGGIFVTGLLALFGGTMWLNSRQQVRERGEKVLEFAKWSGDITKEICRC